MIDDELVHIEPIPEPAPYVKPITAESRQRIVIAIAFISILSNLVLMYSLYNKPVVDSTPYTTKLIQRNSPLEQCPGDTMSYQVDTQITRPNTIITYYRTWFDLTIGRTIAPAKEGNGDIGQYKNPVSLNKNSPITATVPFALAGHVLEFDRGFRAGGSADFIFPMTVTIKEGCS